MLFSNDFYIDIKGISVAHKYVLDRVHKCAYPKGRGSYGIVYAINGKAEYNFAKGEKATISKGDILFLSKDTSYSIKTEKEFVHYTINFDINEENSSLDILKSHYFFQNIKSSEQLERSIKKIVLVWTSKKVGYQMQATAYLYELLYILFFGLLSDDNSEKYQRLSPAREYIEQHFCEPITLEFLSKLSNMSVTNFRREWKKLYSDSPIQFRDNLKLQYAKELISSGYYTIFEIAQKSGFDDTSYFVRFFKNKTGITPGEFKKQYHK